MKKILFYSLATSVLFAGAAMAQNWGYASSNNGGYYQQGRPVYQQPVQRQYQQPTARSYQGQSRQQPRYQQPRQQQSQRQMQRYNTDDAQGYYPIQNNNNTDYAWDSQNQWNTKNAKRFYISPRLGISYINFLDSDDEDMSGFGLSLGAAAGMYFGNNFRADVEIGYHFEKELASFDAVDVNYSQIDFMLNGYYDFHNVGTLVPFVGAGVGFFNSEITLDVSSPYGSGEASASDTVLGVALAGGASYPVNDVVSAEGMLRAKYLFDEGSAINLEAIVGARFSF